MYIVYLDQPKAFECAITLEGASIDNSKARLIMETKEGLNFIFHGSITKEGKVHIPVAKLKNILKEEQRGRMSLEVIADDVYFSPWSSDFETALARKVEVLIKEEVQPTKQQTKPKITVEVQNEVKKVDYLKEVAYLLKTNKISINNINENKAKLRKIIDIYCTQKKLTEAQVATLLNKLPDTLYELSYAN